MSAEVSRITTVVVKIIWRRVIAPAGPYEGIFMNADGKQVRVQELNLSWVTSLFNVAWMSGSMNVHGVVGRGSGSHFKKGDLRLFSNYRGITLLSLPWKVSSRVLERRL